MNAITTGTSSAKITSITVTRASGAPRVEDLPPGLRGLQAPPNPDAGAESFSLGAGGTLRSLLDKHRWNKTRAAAELGVGRPTFLKRLKDAGIE